MERDLELMELVNFASTYFVGTRLLKPLLAQALGGKIDPADPNAEWNRWFSTCRPGEITARKSFSCFGNAKVKD